MAVRNRGVRKEYVDEMNLNSVATQQELEDAFTEHINTDHGGSAAILLNTYYYDEIRAKYLSFSTKSVVFYKDGTNIKNQYMYNIPGVTSSTVPYRIFTDHCVIGFEFYSSNDVAAGDIMTLENDIDNSTVMTVTLSETTDNLYADDVDIVVAGGAKLKLYVNDTGIDTPAIKVYMKEINYV